MQRHILFCRAPWGSGEGPKGQISLNIIKFQLQSQFQRFLNQTLCVFSHMKYIKHIRQDFHLVAWVMPKGSDLGVPWGVCGVMFLKFNKICRGAKRSNIIKYELQSQFQRFLNQTLCIFSKLKIYNISDGIFIPPPGSCPGVGLGGTVGGWG